MSANTDLIRIMVSSTWLALEGCNTWIYILILICNQNKKYKNENQNAAFYCAVLPYLGIM